MNLIMAEAPEDEVFDIAARSYGRIEKDFEASGYTEGITESRNANFQESFDHGYEDGFRIGFLLGKAQQEKASRGGCAICADPTFIQKPEADVREKHRQDYETHEKSNSV